MHKNYCHLGYDDRIQISLLLEAGLSVREIAAELGRSPSTVSREIRRYKSIPCGVGYDSFEADRHADIRRIKPRKSALLKSELIHQYVTEKLRLKWSPELIAGRLPLEHPDSSISHEAIYQFIYRNAREFIPCLAQARKKRHPRRHLKKWGGTPIPQKTGISERPEAANDRSEIGHWEVDTVRSSLNAKASLVVMIDRRSRYAQIRKLKAKSSAEVEKALVESLAKLPQTLRRTLTYDNGAENSCHLRVNAILNTKSFFCKPYHSWEKGTVENTIALIRRFVPYRSNLESVTPEQLDSIQSWLNDRPRKCLNFKTPREIFTLSNVALIS